MRVVITGATGFIGKRLCSKLVADYEVVALTRNVDKAVKTLGYTIKSVYWDASRMGDWIKEVDGAGAVVNLAGENITGRWNKEKKYRILSSRTESITAIIEGIKKVKDKPKIVVQASAIGYYGPQRDKVLDENSDKGEGFLADVCDRIESLAKEIENYGPKSIIIRTGVVLGEHGGALARFIPAFKFYMGGWPGDGKQWFSWIHIDDETEAIKFLIEQDNLEGVFNLTAPKPVMMKEFCRKLAKVMKRPCWMAIPAFVLKSIYGQMVDETILGGQNAVPNRLLQAGFDFRCKDVQSALNTIFKKGDNCGLR